MHVCAQLQPQACKVQGLSKRAGSSLKRLIAGSVINRRQHVLSFVARCLVHLTRQRSSMKRALISKCRGVRFGRLCFLNASICHWSMILFSTVACTESISTVRHTCVDVFLRRCSDVSRGHVRRVGTDVLCFFFLQIVIMLCISCASDVRVHVPSSLLHVRRVGTDVLCCLSCDHELFFLCVCRGQVHVQFMWLD